MTYLLFAAAIAVTLLSSMELTFARPASIFLLGIVASGLALTAPSCRPPIVWTCLLAVAAVGAIQLTTGLAANPPGTARP